MDNVLMLYNYLKGLDVEGTEMNCEFDHLQEVLNEMLYTPTNVPPFTDVVLVTKAALMNDERVIFGELPEVTYREMIADALTLKELQ
jgi:hypothetical protein